MIIKSKLKGSFGRIYPIAILITYVLTISEYMIRQSFNKHGYELPLAPIYSVIALGIFFVVMGFIQLFKYSLWVYPVLGILCGISTSLSMAHYINSFFTVEMYVIAIIVVILFIVLNWNVLYSQEKLEANARRLFKLAAELIYETSDGFTERPFSAGKAEFSKDELLGFARFMNGKYFVKSFYFNNMVYLAFSLNQSAVNVSDPKLISHVLFDKEGNISVSISEKDYRQYRERINFNQLCGSVGNVFKRFLEYYKNGNEARIITELKTAR